MFNNRGLFYADYIEIPNLVKPHDPNTQLGLFVTIKFKSKLFPKDKQ